MLLGPSGNQPCDIGCQLCLQQHWEPQGGVFAFPPSAWPPPDPDRPVSKVLMGRSHVDQHKESLHCILSAPCSLASTCLAPCLAACPCLGHLQGGNGTGSGGGIAGSRPQNYKWSLDLLVALYTHQSQADLCCVFLDFCMQYLAMQSRLTLNAEMQPPDGGVTDVCSHTQTLSQSLVMRGSVCLTRLLATEESEPVI